MLFFLQRLDADFHSGTQLIVAGNKTKIIHMTSHIFKVPKKKNHSSSQVDLFFSGKPKQETIGTKIKSLDKKKKLLLKTPKIKLS